MSATSNTSSAERSRSAPRVNDAAAGGEPRPQIRLHRHPVERRADDGGIPADDLPPAVHLGVPGERAATVLGERGECAHGARDRGRRGTGRRRRFQFTRARGARPARRIVDVADELFQFTRARGARLARQMAGICHERFQFTRARGARPDGRLRVQLEDGFNSRAHGARDLRGYTVIPPKAVSIHARTGRATYLQTYPAREDGFNSRAHGARDVRRAGPGDDTRFQFTRARGARPPGILQGPTREEFQFTRARGARHPAPPNYLGTPIVSIHARTGRATHAPRCPTPCTGCFNSRAHGARDLGSLTPRLFVQVSIHARTGRATRTKPTPAVRDICFNSRAHGARDTSAPPSRGMTAVSIHARTGRATGRSCHPTTCSPGFNSRAHGARDPARSPSGTAGRCFNSRAHGARDNRLPIDFPVVAVSIHARTGRATGRAKPSPAAVNQFQFTRARGARQSPPHRLPCCRSFNSRAHGARDDLAAYPQPKGHRFNSRAHGARDLVGVYSGGKKQVSIHARTGRATASNIGSAVKCRSFNSRAHGARDGTPRRACLGVGFQFTRARGARPGSVRVTDCEEVFQFTRARGARHPPARTPVQERGFQFTRARGARRSAAARLSFIFVFQFTRARGARLAGRCVRAGGLGFNSRAHGARDPTPTTSARA